MAGSTSSPIASFARRTRTLASFAALALLVGSGPLSAAPLPPLPPVNICANILSAAWLPPRTAPATPRMSGSAGRERSWPGRFVVIVNNVRGVGPREIARINALLATSPDGGAAAHLRPNLLLLVLASGDRSRLTGMKSLCVQGFTIRGDEGGTWTHHSGLKTFTGDYPGSGKK